MATPKRDKRRLMETLIERMIREFFKASKCVLSGIFVGVIRVIRVISVIRVIRVIRVVRVIRFIRVVRFVRVIRVIRSTQLAIQFSGY